MRAAQRCLDRELGAARFDASYQPSRRDSIEGAGRIGEPVTREFDGSSCFNADIGRLGRLKIRAVIGHSSTFVTVHKVKRTAEGKRESCARRGLQWMAHQPLSTYDPLFAASMGLKTAFAPPDETFSPFIIFLLKCRFE